MPYVEAPTLTDISAKDRKKLSRYLFERQVLGYAFSYSKLHKLLVSYMDTDTAHEALQDCILAFDTNQEEDAKKDLNEQISSLLAENGLTGVRSPDPFGRLMDCSIYESKSGPRFNRNKAVEMAPSFGVSTTKIIEILDSATEPGKSYVAVRVAAVKEKGEKEK